METNKEEILDSETQDNVGDDVTEQSEDTSSEIEPANESSEEIEKARKIAEDQKRRAEKAEQKLKELKAQLEDSKTEPQEEAEEQKTAKPVGDSLTKEEAILYARGLSEEEVEKVKHIAKLEGESPLVAAESDYFKSWKEKQDRQKETQETQLGASRGSVKSKPKKDISSPGLTPEEHKALWKEIMGR